MAARTLDVDTLEAGVVFPIVQDPWLDLFGCSEGFWVLHSVFKCMTKPCKGQWHSAFGSLLERSPFCTDFLTFCCTANATLVSSLAGFVIWDSVSSQSKTALVVKFFRSLNKCCMIELNASRGSLTTRNKARIPSLSLNPRCEVVSSTNSLCSDWVLLTTSSININPSDFWKTIALMEFTTTSLRFSPWPCWRDSIGIALLGCCAPDIALRLYQSMVVLIANSTCAWCIRHSGTLVMTVGLGTFARIKIPKPQALRWISRSRFQATYFPNDSLVRCFSNEELGAVVLAGGLQGIRGGMAAIMEIVRMSVMNELKSNESMEWYDPADIVAWFEPRRSKVADWVWDRVGYGMPQRP